MNKIGSSDLLSEHFDPFYFIVLFYFTVLGREHSGKVSKKKSSVTFISDESP